jgi:hypothetical protein
VLYDINWASERRVSLQEGRQRERLLEQFTTAELREEKKRRNKVVGRAYSLVFRFRRS